MDEYQYEPRHRQGNTGRIEVPLPPEVRVRYVPKHRAPKHRDTYEWENDGFPPLYHFSDGSVCLADLMALHRA